MVRSKQELLGLELRNIVRNSNSLNSLVAQVIPGEQEGACSGPLAVKSSRIMNFFFNYLLNFSITARSSQTLHKHILA